MKKLIRSKIFAVSLAASVAVTALLAGCSSQNEDSGNKEEQNVEKDKGDGTYFEDGVKLSYLTWDYSDRTPSTDKWIEGCKEKFNIEIELQNVPTTEYSASVIAKIAANDMPDFIKVHGITPAYDCTDGFEVTDGMFADISDLENTKNFTDTAKECVTRDGQILYMPVSTNAIGVLYNKQVFKDNDLELPEDIEEFKKVCEAFKEKGVIPLAAGFKDDYMGQWLPIIGIAQYIDSPDSSTKEKLYDPKTQTSEMTYEEVGQPMLDALKLNLDWIDNGYFSDDPLGSDANSAAQMVGSGKAAMLITGTFDYSVISSYAGNPEDIGFFPLPLNEPGEKSAIPTDTDEGICINNKGENVEAAKAALNYYLSDEIQTAVAEDLQGIPTNVNVSVDSHFIKEVQEQFDKNEVIGTWWGCQGFYYPKGMTFTKEKECQNLIAGAITPEDFVKKLDESIAEYLQDNK